VGTYRCFIRTWRPSLSGYSDDEFGVTPHKSVQIHLRTARNQEVCANQTVIKDRIEATASYIRPTGLFKFISDITVEIPVSWDTEHVWNFK
jgi:hypothetical protein